MASVSECTEAVAQVSRRQFVKAVAGTALVIPPASKENAKPPLSLDISEEGRFYASLQDSTQLSIEGPHRFLTVSGLGGFQPTSLLTKATIQCALHRSPKGTLSFWFTPLEDLAFGPGIPSMTDQLADAYTLPLVSDTFPPRHVGGQKFGVYWSNGYPQLVAKFASGRIWSRLDRELAPFVYGEKLTVHQGQWYFVTLTWERPGKKAFVYVNGMMMGHNLAADDFEDGETTLFLGNPLMVMRELLFEDAVLDDRQIKERYRARRPSSNGLADQEIERWVTPRYLASLDTRRPDSWRKALWCPFTDDKDLSGWLFQTGDKYKSLFDVRITREGLLVKTPEMIGVDTRMYLWSPRAFEGDQWIEYDFRLESPKGLSLLVVCANGSQREDVFTDHGVPATGSMGTILGRTRNYHWEYVRRVEAMRTDVETQFLAKNPGGPLLHAGCIPRLQQNRWYKMRLLKAGNRLHGSIDGEAVFDVFDDPFQHNGPVYNFGRIGLRQMYHTTMRYRNLVVYESGPAGEVRGSRG